MSILDTFYILFKTDADDAAKEVQTLDDKLDKAEKQAKRTDAAVSKVGASFLNMAAAIAAPLLALASLDGIMSVVSNRIEEIGTIGDDALKLRSTPQEYDAFTRAVRAAGGEMAAAQANLTTFAEKLNDAAARASGPNAKNFAKWGIAFKDVNGEAVGAVDGILALAKSLENVSRAEALGRLKKLGIEDADTIDFLLQGKAAILEKMEAEKEAGLVTDRQIELEGEYQSTVGRTRNILDSIAGTITEMLLPAMIAGYRGFNDLFSWIKQNQTLVAGFFTALATVLTVLYAPAMLAAATATWAALAPILLMAAPFLAVAAAIAAVSAAIALAYEDIMAFVNGQPSLLGELVRRYQLVATAVDAIGAAWNGTKSAYETFKQGIADLQKTSDDFFASESWTEFAEAMVRDGKAMSDALNPFREAIADLQTKVDALLASSWEDFKSGAVQAFNDVKEAIATLQAAVDGLFASLRQAFSMSVPSPAAFGGATPAGQAVPAYMGGMTVPGLAAGQRQIGAASSVPAAGLAPGASPTVNNTSNVTVGGVTVNTQATDAKGVASAVRSELSNQLRGAGAQFDDGVDR